MVKDEREGYNTQMSPIEIKYKNPLKDNERVFVLKEIETKREISLGTESLTVSLSSEPNLVGDIGVIEPKDPTKITVLRVKDGERSKLINFPIFTKPGDELEVYKSEDGSKLIIKHTST